MPGYPPPDALLAALGEAASDPASAGYGEIAGEPALRAATARLLGEADAGRIAITSGCNQAFVCAALALAGPGARMAVSDPAYFNHSATLAMLGIEAVPVRRRADDGFVASVEAVEAALDQGARAVALVSPDNPTGAILPRERLTAILAACEAAGAALVLDETYRDFDAGARHGLAGHPALVRLYSFSKALCIPGHRLGAIAAPPAVIAGVEAVMDNLQICAPRAAQRAVAATLDALAGWRAGNAAEIAHRAEALEAVLAARPDWPASSRGAYFAWVRHPFAEGSVEGARRLAEAHGIVAIPGAFFGAGWDDHLRLAFANVDARAISTLTERLPEAGG